MAFSRRFDEAYLALQVENIAGKINTELYTSYISAAAAADAFAETGKGFANQLMALGIVETVAIFVLAFSIVLLSSLGAA